MDYWALSSQKSRCWQCGVIFLGVISIIHDCGFINSFSTKLCIECIPLHMTLFSVSLLTLGLVFNPGPNTQKLKGIWISFKHIWKPMKEYKLEKINQICALKYICIKFIFRERRMEGEREGEKHWCEREPLISCFPYMPWPGTESTIQACALTRNRTCSLSFCGVTLNQLSHNGQGIFMLLKDCFLSRGRG